MSYILDALKRADAQRERGTVPGLHAQSQAGMRRSAGRPGAWPVLVWLLGGVVVVLLGVVAWLVMQPVPKLVVTAPAPVQGGVVNAVGTQAPAPRPSASLVERPSNVSAPDVPRAVPPPTVKAAAAEVAPKPVPAAAPRVPAQASSPSPARKASAPQPSSAPEAPKETTASRPAERPASASPTPLATRESLPAQIRAELPAMVFSGGSYSDNPLHRMIIVNGQVYQESARIAPDLTVEQIRPNGAVLNFKGNRFLVPF